ncbi:general odorant-binding protein 56a-like [Cryptotermes secundus]|uniref:general odorant-binding protein 56a-like n=1 Tax=Cryptotermes secundus TaxID=105785 RepID=UPI000CD7CEDC|nr:general odorant-binding protein 56a-like [Cryptotermes secundus]
MEHLKLLTLTFVIAFKICIASSDEMQEIVDAQTKCQKEHGITDETFIEIRNREMILEDESDESMKCLIQCMLVGLGMLKDGQLDVNAVMNIAKPLLDNIEQQGREVDEESLRSDIANCTDTSQKGECTGGYEMWKCLHGIMSNVMLSAPEPK